MKLILFSLILFTLPQAFAEIFVADLKSQSVQVLGEESQPTSCRLYRKRMEAFLQRLNEASLAAKVRAKRFTLAEAQHLTDLIQRSNLPLDLMTEKIVWTIDFDISKSIGAITHLPLVEIDSTYLQWQTNEGFFPDHFQVQVHPEFQIARIIYKMTYMEACLAPIEVKFKISDSNANSVQGQAFVEQDLL